MKILPDFHENWFTTVFRYIENKTDHKNYRRRTGSKNNQFINKFLKICQENLKSHQLYFGALKTNSSLETVSAEHMIR